MTDRARIGPARESAGFTLIELMIVLVVVSLGILALSGLQTTAERDVYATGRRTSAVALAQSRLELERSLGYGSAAADSGQSSIYSWNTRVDSVGVGLQQVLVAVTWTDQGQAKQVQLVDLISAR